MRGFDEARSEQKKTISMSTAVVDEEDARKIDREGIPVVRVQRCWEQKIPEKVIEWEIKSLVLITRRSHKIFTVTAERFTF